MVSQQTKEWPVSLTFIKATLPKYKNPLIYSNDIKKFVYIKNEPHKAMMWPKN